MRHLFVVVVYTYNDQSKYNVLILMWWIWYQVPYITFPSYLEKIYVMMSGNMNEKYLKNDEN